MKKLGLRKIIILFMFALAISVLYIAFETDISNKLNINDAKKYPLAQADILPEIKQDINISQIQAGAISVTTQFNTSVFANIPEEAPVYNYEESKYTSRQNEESVFKTFGFENAKYESHTDQVLGRSASVSNNLGSLSIYENQGMLSYSRKYQEQLSTFGSIVDTETFKAKAEEYIKSTGIDLGSFVFSKIKFYVVSGNDAEQVSSSARAQILEVLYTAKVSEFSIIDNSTDPNGNIVRVWFDKNQNVLRLDYQNTGTIGEKTGIYKLKSTDQIINDVNQGKIKMIKSDTPFGQNLSATSIQSLKLAYYALDGFLIPVYILQGNSTTTTGERGATYLMMEAVAR